MSDTATFHRLLRMHLDAASVILDALSEHEAEPAPPDEPEEIVPACPHCGEVRDEKLEATPFAGEGGKLVQRVTCLSCGKSNPESEELSNG